MELFLHQIQSEGMKQQLTKEINFLKSLGSKAMLSNDDLNIDDYYARRSTLHRCELCYV